MKTLNIGKDAKKIFCMILISFVVTFLFYFFLAKSMNMWDNEIAGYIFYGMFQFAIILFAFKEQLRYADKVMNMIIIYGISLICTGISIKVNSNIVEPLLWIPVIYALYTDYKIAMISGVLSVSSSYVDISPYDIFPGAESISIPAYAFLFESYEEYAVISVVLPTIRTSPPLAFKSANLQIASVFNSNFK